MAWMIRMGRFLASSALLLSLGACGSPSAPVLAPASSRAVTVPESKAVPPQSAFVVVQCQVVKLLPDDNDGLTHQNFVVRELKEDKELMVNNSTTHGQKVEGLKVGDKLEIRGVIYRGKNGRSDGIHWTHHADKEGDAGYIKRGNTTYQ